PPPGSWNPPATASGQRPCPPPGSGSPSWPGGSPASAKSTATTACSGPPTAPWKPTTPPTSARWPPPPARQASPSPRSPEPSGPPGAPARPTPNRMIARPKEQAEMTTNPQSADHNSPAVPARPAIGQDDAREKIRRLRAQGGTYRSIADAVGLAPATIHDLESGRRSPTPATSRALAKVNG